MLNSKLFVLSFWEEKLKIKSPSEQIYTLMQYMQTCQLKLTKC